MHIPTDTIFPGSGTAAVTGSSNGLNGPLQVNHHSILQLNFDRQFEGLSNITPQPKAAKAPYLEPTQGHGPGHEQIWKQNQFEQGSIPGFDTLTQHGAQLTSPGQHHQPILDQGNDRRDLQKLSYNDRDLLTGSHQHLVGETGRELGATDSLTRTFRVTVPSFPGRAMKYNPGHLMHGEDIRQWQAQMKSRGWNISVDGIYGRQSAQVCRLFQQEKGLQVDGIVGPKTWNAAWTAPITGGAPHPPIPSGATGSAIAKLARDIVEGKYNGGRHPQYVFGAENKPFDPSSVKKTDCSELVQVVVSSTLKKTFVDGSWNQAAACQKISVAQALQTPGALLFVYRNGRVNHVEVSLGNGYTAAARSTRSGVGVFKANIRYTSGGLIPGISY